MSKLDGQKFIEIDEVVDFATHVDRADLARNIALRTRGLRITRPGMVAERDFGTIERHVNYPATPSALDFINHTTVYIQENNREYDILVGLDTNNESHIFVFDEDEARSYDDNDWIELTKRITARVDVGTPSGVTVNIDTMADSLGNTYAPAAQELKQWIVHNDTRGNGSLIIANTATVAAQLTITLPNTVNTALGWTDNDELTLWRCLGIKDGFEFRTGDLKNPSHIRWLDVQAHNKVNMYYGWDQKFGEKPFAPIQIRKGTVVRQVNAVDLTPPIRKPHEAIEFADDNIGIAVGIYAYGWRTTNGGNDWTRQTGNWTVGMFDVNFGTSTVGWAVGNRGNVWTTVDAGLNWTQQTSNTNQLLRAVFAVNASEAWAVGNGGVVIRTLDGGTTWVVQTSGAGSTNLRGVWFNDIDNGWFCGDSGLVRNTTNGSNGGGSSWTTQTTNTTVRLQDIFGVDVNTVWFVGNGDLVRRELTVFKTTNGGTTWDNQRNNFDRSFRISTIDCRRIRMVDANVGYIAHSAFILNTVDGTNWSLFTALPTGQDWRGLAVRAEDRVWAASGKAGRIFGFASFIHKGWYVHKSHLTTAYESTGTITDPRDSVDGSVPTEIEGGIEITATVSHQPQPTGEDPDKLRWIRTYVTVFYDGYQESDPIFQHFSESTAPGQFPQVALQFAIDHSRLDKRISSFGIYVDSKYDEDVTEGELWPDDESRYFLIKELALADPDWTEDTGEEFSRRATFTITPTVYYREAASNRSNLLDNLAHAVDKNRVPITPRFAVKAGRSQGGVIVIDESDQTLRLSTYGGAGQHMDDAFPNLTVDNSGNKQKLFLTGKGKILGLGFVKDDVAVLRSTEIELIDLFSGVPTVIPIDCIAKLSILETPFGLVWAGKAGIYILPIDGSGVRLLNPNWVNLYDGTLPLDSDPTAKFVVNTHREGVICGYDETFRELWVQLHTMDIFSVVRVAIPVFTASNASPIRIQATAHGLITGTFVTVDEVQGNEAANGIFQVTRIDADNVDLDNSSGNGVYVSGGIIMESEFMNFRYSFDHNKWFARKLNMSGFGDVKTFSRRKDGTMTICYEDGLLKYPLREIPRGGNATSVHQDSVTSAGNDPAGGARGIDTRLRINVGELYSLRQPVSLHDIIIDHDITSATLADFFDIDLYVNGETTTVDAKTATRESDRVPRKFAPRGPVSRAEIEISIPSAQRVNIQQFDISKISLSYTEFERTGNT